MLQILLFLLPLLCCLQTRADIVEDFSQTRGVNAGSSSMLVIDLSTGETVLEMNADIPLIPASIMKCVTTATLLSRLDEDARFHTEVYAAGTVRDGVLDGNLIIVGSGDPSLNSRHVEGNKDICSQIAAALTERGVRSIAGRIVVDEDVWSGPAVPPSWMSGDLPHAYGTGSHGLNFEDNASGSRSVSNPAAVFDTRLQAALERNGIVVEGESVREGERELILDHESVPLDEIMRSCMMRSDNQYAEALLRSYAVADGGKGSVSDAAAQESEY